MQTSKRTKTGRASGREGAEPPVSSSLAMLVCLGSAATASSGSDCRVNHQADLNNYRLLKKKGGGVKGINKERREQPPDFSEPGRGARWEWVSVAPADPESMEWDAV